MKSWHCNHSGLNNARVTFYDAYNHGRNQGNRTQTSHSLLARSIYSLFTWTFHSSALFIVFHYGISVEGFLNGAGIPARAAALRKPSIIAACIIVTTGYNWFPVRPMAPSNFSISTVPPFSVGFSLNSPTPFYPPFQFYLVYLS